MALALALNVGAGLGSVASAALAAAVIAPLVQAPAAGEALQLGAGWRVATLPRQTKPVTRFAAERVDGRDAVRLDADASYGNLLHEPPTAPAPRLLHWAWRMQQPNPATELRTKAGDDTAAKVCLSFELPLASIPFTERTLLRLMRAQTGENLPAATLCWVWGRLEAHGAVIDNAFTRRVRYIVLRNAADAPGTWFEETRDIAADFQRTFGDEAASPPPLTAVLVGADADNTHTHTVAHVAGVRFEP